MTGPNFLEWAQEVLAKGGMHDSQVALYQLAQAILADNEKQEADFQQRLDEARVENLVVRITGAAGRGNAHYAAFLIDKVNELGFDVFKEDGGYRWRRKERNVKSAGERLIDAAKEARIQIKEGGDHE